MVAQSFNPSTGKAEAGRFLFMSALSIEGVSGQPGLHRETLTQKPKPKPDKQTNKQKIDGAKTIADLGPIVRSGHH